MHAIVDANNLCFVRLRHLKIFSLIFSFQVSDNVHKLDFQFLPEKIDLFYDSLPLNIKQIVMHDDIFEIEINGRVYYAFYDLEDGNYLAVNEKLEVYSLVHDATPMVMKQKISFDKILVDLQTNKFNKGQHLKERLSRQR